MSDISRRNFLVGSATAAVALAGGSLLGERTKAQSPFPLAVISDEISPDFEHACTVISQDFGLQRVELRSM